MDQIKIGKFIAECRKAKGMTQMQLAESLGITDRAVSKWETGKTMPDSSIMLELCGLLEITVNDLLNGERISAEDYAQKVEAQLIAVMQEKEQSDKKMGLFGAVFTSVAAVLAIVGAFALFAYNDSSDVIWYQVAMRCFSFLLMLCGVAMILLSTKIGYYQCSHCGNIYKQKIIHAYLCLHPKNLQCGFKDTKAYIRCPKCRKWDWHEKVYSKQGKSAK